MRALGRAISVHVPMCLSRFLLGLESSARDWSRNQRSRADVFESSHVGGCKYKRYVQYISTNEQLQIKTSRKLNDPYEQPSSA